MFEISSKKVDFGKENTLIKRNINLDKNLDCFILISTNDNNFGDLVLNNILEFIIDKISKDNTYNDFSIALENVNAFIKTWELDSKKDLKTDIVISILNENNYIFSNIGKSSCYLINGNNEVIELTTKEDNKKEFNFVSSGELKNGEIIISSTRRLLKYLSKSDLLDGLILSENIEIFNKNIKNILLSEKLNKNILVSSMKYISLENKENISKIDLAKEYLFKTFDNKISKNIIGYFLFLKDKINKSDKNIKNSLFIFIILLGVFFLYSILSTVIGITTQDEQKDIARNDIVQAKTYIKIASENIANNDIFEVNIKQASLLVEKVKKENIFLNDVEKINDNINILKKQFNKIEIFTEDEDNIIYKEDIKDPIKTIKNNKKLYIVTRKGVIPKIIPNTKAKTYIFNSLKTNEEFIDATFIGDNMYLLTNLSKIVKFTKNGYFQYIDVEGQNTWEKAKSISSYAQNIYLLGDDNQIYKHRLTGKTFAKASGYLKKEDLIQIGEIKSIAIDGGFYILKKDLSIIKFFSNPKYRIEKIVLNKLPNNYNITEENSLLSLETESNLKYIYLLMNNKIWVFKPNTTNFKNTKSLTYIGQIEGNKNKIMDFSINYDGELVILNKKGLYKIKFEISDDRLLIR